MNMARELQNDQIIKNRLYDGGLRDQSPLLGPVFTAQHFGARLALQ